MRKYISIFALTTSMLGCSEISASNIAGVDCQTDLVEVSEAGIEIKIGNAKYADCPSQFKKGYWGADNREPKTYVSEFSVKFESKVVYVPLTAYSALGEVTNAELSIGPEAVALKIFGGFADSGAYISELTFTRDPDFGLLIQSQRTYVTAFPEEAFELIEYSFPDNN